MNDKEMKLYTSGNPNRPATHQELSMAVNSLGANPRNVEERGVMIFHQLRINRGRRLIEIIGLLNQRIDDFVRPIPVIGSDRFNWKLAVGVSALAGTVLAVTGTPVAEAYIVSAAAGSVYGYASKRFGAVLRQI